MEKTFCFTIDDNIKFLKQTAAECREGLFDHPYTAMLRRLHDKYGLKIQLNLFYRDNDFDLSDMPDKYRGEFLSSAEWLKLSFHSDRENDHPYENAEYDEVLSDCTRVQNEIKRFASARSLAKTTTVHFCRTTPGGLKALKDSGVKGLLGLFDGQTSYGLTGEEASIIRSGEFVSKDGTVFAGIDAVMNLYDQAELQTRLEALSERGHINVMIHEQYFYKDYPFYQPDFEEKISKAFEIFKSCGRKSVFFEDMLKNI